MSTVIKPAPILMKNQRMLSFPIVFQLPLATMIMKSITDRNKYRVHIWKKRSKFCPRKRDNTPQVPYINAANNKAMVPLEDVFTKI